MTTVAMFGDGNGYRVLQHAANIAGPEFQFMKFDYGAPTPEGSGLAPGTDLALGTEWLDTTVAERIPLYFDKYGVPDITWIGFNASALSLIMAAFGIWEPSIAERELEYILDAAHSATTLGSTPLLSTGPGLPVAALKNADKLNNVCQLEAAVGIVSQGVRDSDFMSVEWGLDRSDEFLWDQDQVHVSADPNLCYPGLVQVDRPYYAAEMIAQRCMVEFWGLT